MSLANVITRSHAEKEAWRYTDLEKFLAGINKAEKMDSRLRGNDAPVLPQTLPSIISDPTQRHQIVFVNGVAQPKLSHLGSLPKGVVEFGTNECRLTLEDQTCLVTEVIELVFVNDAQATESSSHLNIKIGQNARMALIEHHVATNAAPASYVLESSVHLGAQSKLVHGKILHDQENMAHLARTQVHVDGGAYYRNFALLKNVRLARNEIDVTLAGRLAQCALNGIMLLCGKQHMDTLTRITHAAPHGISRELYKSIVKDQARGVFQGKIVVAEGAQKTDGRQLSRALLLSDQAEMDAKPELEIYADDVSCSHGCTVGELDADALFYLQARGIEENAARAMLLRAFIDEMIDDMQVAEWRDYALAEAGRWLDEQS